MGPGLGRKRRRPARRNAARRPRCRTCGGYGFRFGDEGFRDAFNEELLDLMESGEVVEIVEPFGFGEEEVEAALGTSAAEMCEPR